MAQHGQVLKLRTPRADGKAVWAYRYRVNGRRSKRSQVGGFATRAEAERALFQTLKRLRPGAEMTLAELVEEYLEPPSRSEPGSRSSISRASWARAWR